MFSPYRRKRYYTHKIVSDLFSRMKQLVSRQETVCFIVRNRGISKLKIPHKSHADFCSTDTAGGLDNKKRRYAPRGGVAYCLFLWGFPKGAKPPFGTRLCEAKCSVLYLLAWLTGETGGAVLYAPRLLRQENGLNFCEWEWAKNRAVFRERRQVYERPRPSSYAPTCGQSVPKLWPHSRKNSRTAGNRQGWNERVCTRSWPPPAVPLNGWTRRPIPQSAWPLTGSAGFATCLYQVLAFCWSKTFG